MTFTEAAAQVLRLVGKPLHYKEITDVAIEKDLLSHVGKSPEVTMGARLAALVKKGDRDNPLIRVRPGVFALRDWDQKTIDAGLGDRTPALDVLAELEKRQPGSGEGDAAASSEPAATPRPERSQPSVPRINEEEYNEVLGEDEKARAQLAATATQLFASEDDDDDPIFAADEEENGEADTLDSSGAGKRRRRRRRRRGGERDDDDLPTYTVMDAPFEATEESQSEPAEARPPREPNRDNREARRPAPERSDEERETRRQREPREDDRDRDKPTNDKPINAEELSGAGLADSIESLLAPFQRQGWASSRQVADALLRRAKNAFSDAQQAHTAVISAIRIDNMRRGATGQRPRFRTSNGRLGLTEWLLDSESLRLERDLFALIQRYRETVRRGFLRKLNELPQRGFTELVQLLLERMGYSDFKSVRRPGAHQSEQHFSALAGGSFGEMRVAVIVRRDGRDIGRERVTDLRGALHHYGPASGGVLVTTGQALSGAREEAAASAAAPMVLVDGAALARLADEQAVGLNHSEIRLPLLDVELIDSLKNNG